MIVAGHDDGKRRQIAVKARPIATVAFACTLTSFGTHAAEPSQSRPLIAIDAPRHDPLFLDAASLRRNGTAVSFKYLLDVLAPPAEEGVKPSGWRSNEIEATMDCRKRTVLVRRLVAYSGPRGTGTATAVHSFTSAGAKPEAITPNSTFAYLEAHVCRDK
jgi:hypothetical protein